MTYSAIPANSEPVVVVAAAQRVHALDHLDGIARAVLGALASFATTERPEWACGAGTAWVSPSLTELARVVRFSERSVRTALRELEAAGLILTQGTGDGNAHGYALHLSDLWNATTRRAAQ